MKSIHCMPDRLGRSVDQCIAHIKQIFHFIIYHVPQAHCIRSQWLHRPPMLNAFYYMNSLLYTHSQFPSNEIVGNMNPMRWLICNIHCHWYMCVMLFIRQPTIDECLFIFLIHQFDSIFNTNRHCDSHWYVSEYVNVLVALNPTQFRQERKKKNVEP